MDARGDRSWLTVAAVALVAVLIGVVAVVASRSGGGGSHSLPAVAATSGDSLLVPAAPPDGMQLWSIAVAPREPAATAPGALVDQLFGRDGQARIEITLDPTVEGKSTAISAGTPQTIRGQRGYLYMADQQTTEVSSAPSTVEVPTQGASDQLTWFEHGQYITARFRDLTARQALDFVGAMTWASTKPADGFVAGSGSDLTTLLAATPRRATGVGLAATFTYAGIHDPSDALVVNTCPDGIGLCPASFYDYADVWFQGTHHPDGSASAVLTGMDVNSPGSSEARFVQAWPAGGTVDVAFPGQHVDLAVAQRLVDGVELTNSAGLRVQRAALSARLAALPTLTVAVLPNGRVEVHGGGGVTAVCFRSVALSLTCPGATLDDALSSGRQTAPASVLDAAGHWWLAVVMTGSGQLSFSRSGDPRDVGIGTPLPGQATTTVAGPAGQALQVGLVQVPDGIASVLAALSGNGPATEAGRPGL